MPSPLLSLREAWGEEYAPASVIPSSSPPLHTAESSPSATPDSSVASARLSRSVSDEEAATKEAVALLTTLSRLTQGIDRLERQAALHRQEQTRRFEVLSIGGAVFAAILFYYLERLVAARSG